MDTEIDSDPLLGRLVSGGVHLVKSLGPSRPRNQNRCSECGKLWMDGKLTSVQVDGVAMRLCVCCLHQMKGLDDGR